MSKSERFLLWTCATASAVLRAVAFFRYRFDADEQQHAHVAWGWTAGLVQYRDFFDNHAPLFHLVTAPWLAMFGETRAILFWMRVPMLALFALVLWCTYEVGKRMYDERVAAWAVVLLSLFPPFFLKSLEYRTDNLWNALWMLTLVLVLRHKPAFVIGLVLGCAMATSFKTPLLLLSLWIALPLTRRFAPPSPRNAGRGALAVAGFATVPTLLAIVFASLGAWKAMLYCTIEFNQQLELTGRNVWIGRALFPLLLGSFLYAAWRWRERFASEWRFFFAIVTGVFAITLACLWPLISPRDFLPVMPLLAIFAAGAVSRLRTYAIGAVACVLALFYYADGFQNRTAWHTTMLDQALRLTRPGEMLLDVKGETIFRRRPVYYVFEKITRVEMDRGILRDTVREDVIRTRTHVAQADGPLWPPRARAFLSENFIDMGRLRASGQWLKSDGSFTIAIPGEYVIVSERGAVSPAREYAAGTYRFPATPNANLAVMWAPAFRRGHSPFHLRDRDF